FGLGACGCTIYCGENSQPPRSPAVCPSTAQEPLSPSPSASRKNCRGESSPYCLMDGQWCCISLVPVVSQSLGSRGGSPESMGARPSSALFGPNRFVSCNWLVFFSN